MAKDFRILNINCIDGNGCEELDNIRGWRKNVGRNEMKLNEVWNLVLGVKCSKRGEERERKAERERGLVDESIFMVVCKSFCLKTYSKDTKREKE